MHDGVHVTLEDVVWHYNTGAGSGTDDFRDAGGTTDGEIDGGPAGGARSIPACRTPCRAAVPIKPLGLTNEETAESSSS